jgi:hypothetical protein
MGTRGRTSMASLMVPENPTEIIQRPDAPYDLTDEQADEWRAVVNTMPAGHFMRGNYALLGQYCRHVVAARRVAQLINLAAKKKEFDRKEFGALLQLQATESAAITRLLRSMRLTQQSVLRAETTKHPKGPRMKAPWDPE